MKKSIEMLFALLRASLHEKETETLYFVDATEADWNECYHLAKIQGVMALVWDGVLRLPFQLHPYEDLKLKWAIKTEMHEKKYLRYCKVAHEITEFYKRHDISTLHLKGVGLSTLYPIPSHREGGDIDIYTFSGSESISDSEANQLADNLIEQQGQNIDVKKSPKHSVFYYKGIPVENHKVFTNIHSYKIASQVESMLRKQMNPQKTLLPTGEVLVPSPMFNTLFVFFHAVQHYGSGLSLHHLCDWAIIIKNYGLHFPEELTDKRLLRAAAALTTLCNHLLGTTIEIKEEKEFAYKMLNEMLHPKYYKRLLPHSKLKVIVYKIKRFIYNQRLKKSIFNHSPWKSLYISVVHHLLYPHKIFN